MKILPAIDIRGGKIVRLTNGDYDKMKVYGDDFRSVTDEFLRCGAKCLHVVDLDGAKDGALSNFSIISEIIRSADLEIEVGGGIRDEERIKKYLDAGASRVIIGTAAINDRVFLIDMVKKYGEHVAVGVDAKNGEVATHGWLEGSGIDSLSFCHELSDIGVKTVIYTDISKDGALGGTNLEIYRTLSQIPGLNIIASGGITYLDEIKKLREMNIYGAIVGKAIYEGRLDLAAAIEASEDNAQ